MIITQQSTVAAVQSLELIVGRIASAFGRAIMNDVTIAARNPNPVDVAHAIIDQCVAANENGAEIM